MRAWPPHTSPSFWTDAQVCSHVPHMVHILSHTDSTAAAWHNARAVVPDFPAVASYVRCHSHPCDVAPYACA